MTDVREATWRFINTAPLAGSRDALDELFAATLEPFGVDRFDCGRLSDGERPQHIRLSDHRLSDWSLYYAEQNFIETDPIRLFADRFQGAFTWSDARRISGQRTGRIWSDASDGGMLEGLIVPMGPRFLSALCVRLMTPEPSFDSNALPLLKSVSMIYGTSLRTIGEAGACAKPAASPQLTNREVECLHWSVRGKTNVEIGSIIGVSRHTVNTHIESAKRKLGVATRVQAAAMAHRLGLLSIT